MLMLLILSLISLGISLLMLILIFLTSKKELINLMFLSPFECGFNPMYMDRRSFSLRFFLIALIFLVFDVELILIFPYLISMMLMKTWVSNLLLILFIFFLSIGLFLEWNQNMLEWVSFI